MSESPASDRDSEPPESASATPDPGEADNESTRPATDQPTAERDQPAAPSNKVGGWSRFGWPASAALIALASLLMPVGRAGIWEPPELDVADQARRIALNVMGASGLSLEGANNTVPTLGELERGELPFTSMALGFKLFGLHDWAGRLPLAVWALVGALCVYLLVARLVDRRAASLSVIALSTMPLYFLQARTMLGDAVTLSAVAMACAGLGLAVFDHDGSFRPRQLGWALLGVAGLAAGFGARGALLGVAVPALGVGLAWLVSHGVRRRGTGFSTLVASASLLVGLFATWKGLYALTHVDPTHYDIWLGAGINEARQRPTFDLVLEQLGHGLLPWSALVPFAIGRLFVVFSPADAETEEALSKRERGLGLHLLLMLVPSLALAAHALMAPTTGELPFCAVFALAAAIGVALSEADQRHFGGSMAAGITVAALAIIYYTDFKNFPVKGLTAFVVEGGKFPDSFAETATKVVKYGTLLCIGGFFGLIFEHGRERDASGVQPFDRKPYREYVATLQDAFEGNLRFFLLLIEAGALAFAVLSFLSSRMLNWERIETMPSQLRSVLALVWLLLPLALTLPVIAMLARDALRWLRARRAFPRFSLAAVPLAAFGLVLSLGYYPALAAQISPKEVFEAYGRLAKPGEPLGMLGDNGQSANYYAGSAVVTQPNAPAAARWLDNAQERRWLVMRADDLAQINAKFRERHHKNLPVLDSRSSEILLASNQLGEAEVDQNPFRDWILDAPREPEFTVGANLDQLTNLGWDLTKDGKPVPTETVDGKPWPVVKPGVDYQFAIHWRVNRSISGNWKTFIHIDGYRKRYNGDHETLGGKYPAHLWRPSDQIVDIHTIRLEPHFTPGRYEVLYGLYIGDRRLEVKKGSHDNNRIKAGFVIVH
ncbi:MAG: glycosyltransferase family 39 protein [Polyangiaceae bacterium]|nr:glycosyltransferase family 39 protein [Polyangiaceae bacterium]MCB9605198.1 glycosyltransferase family 39 protein [Polyangiaceae bacterium]